MKNPETPQEETKMYPVCETREQLLELDTKLADALIGLSSIRTRTITINAFFIKGDSFSLDDFKESVLEKVSSDTARDVFVSEFNNAQISCYRELDSVLVRIANNSEIDMEAKMSIFNSVKAQADKLFREYIVNSIDNNTVPETSVLPVTVHYVLNPEDTKIKLDNLRALKEQIKGTVNRCREVLPEELRVVAWNRYIPPHGDEDVQDHFTELKQVVQGDLDNDTLIIAQMQLLRIYRERINLMLVDVIREDLVSSEQRGFSEEIVLRIGNEYSAERRRRTRRFANFKFQHFGEMRASVIHSRLDGRNFVSVDPRTREFIASGEYDMVPVRMTAEQLPEETRNKLIKLQECAGERYGSSVYSKILKRILYRLGVLSSPEVGAVQIQRYEQNSTPDEGIKTYTIHEEEGRRGLALSNRYRLLIIPSSLGSDLAKMLSRFSHEIVHIIQRISRDDSQLAAVRRLTALGRSDILADAGAIKMEATVLSLFGRERAVNSYQYKMLEAYMQGGNFWDVFNTVYREIQQRENKFDKPMKRERQIGVVYKAVMRLYSNMGAPADRLRPEGRYPTNYSYLRYFLQAFPPYNDVPFYISGIPSHELASGIHEFIPPFRDKEGNIVDEERLATIIIDSAYEVLSK